MSGPAAMWAMEGWQVVAGSYKRDRLRPSQASNNYQKNHLLPTVPLPPYSRTAHLFLEPLSLSVPGPPSISAPTSLPLRSCTLICSESSYL